MIPASTLTEVLTEIKLSYSILKGTYIIVEGESDVKLFRSFFDDSQCQIWWFRGGVQQLEHSLSEIAKTYPLVIGIRDADFMHLEGRTPAIDNLFLTDFHDLEMTMVHNDRVFDKVAAELLASYPNNHFRTRDQLLLGLKFISYLRWLNHTNGIGLKFDSVNFGELYDHSTVSIKHNDYLESLITRSPNATQKDMGEIMLAVEQLMSDNHDLYQLTNGHDFMKIFRLYTNSNRRQANSKDHIESFFRIAYTYSTYKESRLYAQTQQWAADNGVYIYRQ